jgi:predicted nucleic acid-binding protein
MAFLLDTSILGRLANRADVSHPIATAAVAELHRRGEVLHVTPQNLIEFRNFATRPASINGLGLAAPAAEGLAATFEAAFPLLSETPDIYLAWKAIVVALGVVGKQVHDARLVAVCHAHAVTHLLTFNVAHFVRLAGFGPGVMVVDPATV